MDRDDGLTILLAEDNPDHAELTLHALKSLPGVKGVSWVKDGEAALDFLHRRNRYADAAIPRANLVILDLNLPKIGGEDVLRQIKTDDSLAGTTVVILTTSSRPNEIADSYQAGAKAFVTKPVGFGDFIEEVRAVVAELCTAAD